MQDNWGQWSQGSPTGATEDQEEGVRNGHRNNYFGLRISIHHQF